MRSCSPSLSWLCPGGQWGKVSMAKFQPSHLPALTVGEWHTAPMHKLSKTWHYRYQDAMSPFKFGTEKQLWWEEITSKSGQVLRGSISRRPSQDSSVLSLSRSPSPSVPHHNPCYMSAMDNKEIIKGFIWLCLAKWLWGANCKFFFLTELKHPHTFL